MNYSLKKLIEAITTDVCPKSVKLVTSTDTATTTTTTTPLKDVCLEIKTLIDLTIKNSLIYNENLNDIASASISFINTFKSGQGEKKKSKKKGKDKTSKAM